ncbi:MAG TPA: DUF6580 family putative transport protein [Bryobacteraceae bacterium]|nr:DUF6580 family putative transport protein [Bryobacteraceae bacterium]
MDEKSSGRWPGTIWTGIVLLGALARLIPHPWNFTPLVATGLFAGAYARKARSAAAVTLLSLALSDVVLDTFVYRRFDRGFAWIYAAAVVPVLLGRWMRRSKGVPGLAAAMLASSLSFFAITNFAVWLGGLYPHTLSGLAASYAAGIPFYRNQLLGDIFYTAVMFSAYEALTRRRLARAAA